MTLRFSISGGIRAVAFYEGCKGLLILLTGFGLLSLIHRDVADIAERLVHHFHLNPDHRYSRIFLKATEHIDDRRLLSMAIYAAIISLLHLIQAYGLWHERKWAEWLSVVAVGIFLPLEIDHFMRHPTVIRGAILMGNLAVVVFLMYVIRLRSPSRPLAS